MALDLFALPSPLAVPLDSVPVSGWSPISAPRSSRSFATPAPSLPWLISVEAPMPDRRSLPVSGVNVFLALRGNVNMQQATSSIARIEATPTGAARTDTGPSTAGATVTGQANVAAQTAAGVAVAPPERAPTPTPKAKHEAAPLAGRGSAERDKEKSDPLTTPRRSRPTRSSSRVTRAKRRSPASSSCAASSRRRARTGAAASRRASR